MVLKVIKSQPTGGSGPSPNPSAEGELAEGFLIDNRYQILRRASRWTVGDTYLAHDLQFNETVVLVTPDCPPGQIAGFLQRMRIDAERTRPLHRGPVVTIRDTGLLGSGRPFFTLRHVPGTSLWRHIKSEGPLPTEVALRLFEALAHRIKQAHDIGVYLGDIRPANILLVEGADGVAPEIIDLGYARGLFEGVLSLPAPSPAYRSPQQRRRLPLSSGDDIYALGAVLYFMLTARPPRAGNTEDPNIMVGADMGEVVTPPSNVRSDLDFPMYVDQVVLTALATRPEERYRTISDVAHGVEGLMELFALSPKARAMLYNEGKEEETTMDVAPSYPATTGRGPQQAPHQPQQHRSPAGDPPTQPVFPAPQQSRDPHTAVFSRGPGGLTPATMTPATMTPAPGHQPNAAQHRPGSGTRPFEMNELARPATPSSPGEDVFQSVNAAWEQQESGHRESPGRQEVWSGGAASSGQGQHHDPPTRPLHPAQVSAALQGSNGVMGHPSGIQPMMPRMPQAPAPAPAAPQMPASMPPNVMPAPAPEPMPQAAQPEAAILPSLQEMALGAVPATEQVPVHEPVPDDHALQLAPARGHSASEKLPDREERITRAGQDPFSADPLRLESEPLAANAVPSPHRQPERRQRVAMGLVAVALLTAASLGGFLVMKKSRDKDQFLPPPEAGSMTGQNLPVTTASNTPPLSDPKNLAATPSALAGMDPLADAQKNGGAVAENPETPLEDGTDPNAETPVAAEDDRTVTLEVVTDPAGAEVVAVDTSELVCKQTPCTFDRPKEAAGNLVVRVSMQGREPIVRPLPLEKDNSFKLTLEPMVASAEASRPKSPRRSSTKGSNTRKTGVGTVSQSPSTAQVAAQPPTTPPTVAKPAGGDPFGSDPFGEDPFGDLGSPTPAAPTKTAPTVKKADPPKPTPAAPADDPFGEDPFGSDPFGDSAPAKADPPKVTTPAAKAPEKKTPAAKPPAKSADPFGEDPFGEDPFGDDPFAGSTPTKAVKKPAPKPPAPKPPAPKPADSGDDLFANPFE
ncbi:MAG: protein kinase domain-containing protein [Bradymonadia bacterium]